MRNWLVTARYKLATGLLILSLLTPGVAAAQGMPVLDFQQFLKWGWEILKNALQSAAVVSAVNISQQVARDAAEQMASYIVEGSSGKTPLVFLKSPGDYVKDAGKQAMGEWLGTVSKDLGLGDKLCHPPAAVLTGLPYGIFDMISGKATAAANAELRKQGFNLNKRPALDVKCDFDTIADSYGKLRDSLASPSELLASLTDSTGSRQTETDLIITKQLDGLITMASEQKKAELERLATKSYQDQKKPISGKVVEPSQKIAEEGRMNTAVHNMEEQNKLLSGVLASGMNAIPAVFASTFLNSMTNKILQRLAEGKGSLPLDSDGGNLANLFGSGKGGSESQLSNLYASVKTAYVTGGDWDQLTVFSACPSESKAALPENCVIDDGLVSAVRSGNGGKGITVQEAVDQGLLHGDWRLISPADSGKNEERLCYKTAYCYSNLIKLRKARIIPIGWEIAAANAGTGGRVTLAAVVAGFNTCAFTCSKHPAQACSTDADCPPTDSCGGNPQRDLAHPYCHLIDPNWVLKMPENICRAKVSGAQPADSQTPTRQLECVDQATCLQEDGTGRCTGAYGYCTRERNTWRFDADACPAQFAGCRTFSNNEVGQVTVLESTIDSSVCSDKNSGCLGYYTEYKPDGTFDTTAPQIYLNAKAATCDANNIGCTEVKFANTGETKFIKAPPQGLGCKNAVTDPAECKKYTQACTVDEVGCELYQPTSADPAVPGIATFATTDENGSVVDWNDECPKECVGYVSYYPKPTQFEPFPAAPTAFIAPTAQACTQDVAGCDAFTNIDSAANGGGTKAYFSNIQRCRKPDDAPHGVFYTWEGSDQSGYQLHQHDVVVDAGGAPVYDITNIEKQLLGDISAICSGKVYANHLITDKANPNYGKANPNFNPDCREMFDNDGKPYYELLTKLLPSSASCTAVRRVSAAEADCKESRGTFDPISGGCDYFVLPKLSSQCTLPFVGCRAFDGIAATTGHNIFSSSFNVAADWSTGVISNEGATVGDTVLKVTEDATSHTVSVKKSLVYQITFWAKGMGGVSVHLASAGETPADINLNTASTILNPEWTRYQVSSIAMPWSDDNAVLRFAKDKASDAFFLDNVSVKEQDDVVYRIKDTWKTPLSCDPTPSDNIPGPALNCQEYQPQSSPNLSKSYLTGFTSLCRQESAGCQKFQNTYNTTEITTHDVQISSKDPTLIKTLPADEFVYLVASQDSFCPADKKGCSALGMMVKEKNDKGVLASKLEVVYKIDNPSNYANSMCQLEENRCVTFKSGDGQQRYFKYPEGDKRCEYKDKEIPNKDKPDITVSGWFVEGTAQPCYPDLISGSNVYGIYKNADPQFTGNLGQCPIEFNQCTQYIDHADVTREYPNGREYFFEKSAKVDSTTCTGKAGLKDGCVLLDDTSLIGDHAFATMATYCKSDPTIVPNCAEYLSSAAVPKEDRGHDGVATAPVGGPVFTSSNDTKGLDCNLFQRLGITVVTDCTTRISELKKTVKDHKTLTIVDGNGFKAIDLNAYVCDATHDGKELVASAIQMCGKYADANTLIKVRRDRTCAEWLSCQSSNSVYDPQTQKNKEVCTQIGVCNKLASGTTGTGQCESWVTDQVLEPTEQRSRALPLSTRHYVERNVGWFGQEYSGYSLWNKFQPNTLGWFDPTPAEDQKKGKHEEALLGAGFVPEDNVCGTGNNGSVCTAHIFSADSAKKGVKKVAPVILQEGEPGANDPSHALYVSVMLKEGESPAVWNVNDAQLYEYQFMKLDQGVYAFVGGQGVIFKPKELVAVFLNKKNGAGETDTQAKGPGAGWYRDIYVKKAMIPDPDPVKASQGAMVDPSVNYIPEIVSYDAGTNTYLLNDGQVYPAAYVASFAKHYPTALGQKALIQADLNDKGLSDELWLGWVTKIPQEVLADLAISSVVGSEFGESVSFLGTCYDRKCWYPLNGLQQAQPTKEDFDAPSCRAYPEEDSPFPSTVVASDNGFSPLGQVKTLSPIFKKVNVCESYTTTPTAYTKPDKDGTIVKTDGKQWDDLAGFLKIKGNEIGTLLSGLPVQKPGACECSYTKVTYDDSSVVGSSVVYAPIDATPQSLHGICDAGWYVAGDKESAYVGKNSGSQNVLSKKGMACASDADCIDERVIQFKTGTGANKGVQGANNVTYDYSTDDGRCQMPKQITKYVGWKGYCLERDLRSHLNNTQTDLGCETWLPIDIAGGQDIYNQYDQAKFKPSKANGGEYYCAESRGVKKSGVDNSDAYTFAGTLEYAVAGSEYVNTWDQLFGDTIKAFFAPGYIFYAAIMNGVKDPAVAAYGPQAYKQYSENEVKQFGLPATVYPNEIDRIELTATTENAFFPAGYTMNIIDDGRARFYVNKTSVDAAEKLGVTCPGYSPSGVYDLLTPGKAADAGPDFSTSKVLSLISRQIRCGKSAGGIGDGDSCDSYTPGAAISKYFANCSTGDSTFAVSGMPAGAKNMFRDDSKDNNGDLDKTYGPESYADPDGLSRPVAVTGVARDTSIQTTGGKDTNGNEIKPRVSQLGVQFSQIWFVRIDNQLGFADKQYMPYHRRLLVNDIITDDQEYGYTNDDPLPAPRHTSISRGPKLDGTYEDWSACQYNAQVTDPTVQYGRQIGYELRFKFDKTGKFAGIDAGACTARRNAIITAGWKVKIHLRDACTQVAKTTKVDLNEPDGQSTTAWTNRLWSAWPDNGFKKYVDAGLKPNGALPVGSGTIPDSHNYGSFIGGPILLDSALAPQMPWYGHLETPAGTGSGLSGATRFDIANGNSTAFSCPKGTSCVGTSGPVSFEEGKKALLQLFAAYSNVYLSEAPFYGYKKGSSISDASYALGKDHPPTVAAVDTTQCDSRQPSSCRVVRKNGMTVNGLFAPGAIVYGKSSVGATIQFYGWADQEHMPIKRVVLDWGDGTSPMLQTGLYRNHKPVCSTDVQPAAACELTVGGLDPNQTCAADGDCVDSAGKVVGACQVSTGDKTALYSTLKWSFGSWGGNKTGDSGACQTGYFSYGHAYTYSDDCAFTGILPKSLQGAGLNLTHALVADQNMIDALGLAGRVAPKERFCLFQPRVQLLDNWGICNGVKSVDITKGSGDMTPTAYGKNDVGSDCNYDAEDPKNLTPFQGYIIVKE